MCISYYSYKDNDCKKTKNAEQLSGHFDLEIFLQKTIREDFFEFSKQSQKHACIRYVKLFIIFPKRITNYLNFKIFSATVHSCLGCCSPANTSTQASTVICFYIITHFLMKMYIYHITQLVCNQTYELGCTRHHHHHQETYVHFLKLIFHYLHIYKTSTYSSLSLRKLHCHLYRVICIYYIYLNVRNTSMCLFSCLLVLSFYQCSTFFRLFLHAYTLYNNISS